MANSLGVKAIVFDLDETLTRPRNIVLYGVEEVLTDLGLPPLDAVYFTKKIGIETFQQTVSQLYGEEMLPKFLSRYREVFPKYKHMTLQVAGAWNSLKALSERDFRMGIVANKQTFTIHDSLEVCEMSQFFDRNLIVGLNDGYKQKPSGEGIRAVLERMNLQPEYAAMVGDSAVDMEAAMEAGVKKIAVLSGTASREQFSKYEPDLVLESVAELPKNVEKV